MINRYLPASVTCRFKISHLWRQRKELVVYNFGLVLFGKGCGAKVPEYILKKEDLSKIGLNLINPKNEQINQTE